MCNKNGGGISAKKTRYIALEKRGGVCYAKNHPPLSIIVTSSVRYDKPPYMFAAQYHIDHTTKQNVRFTKQNVSNLSTRTKTRICSDIHETRIKQTFII